MNVYISYIALFGLLVVIELLYFRIANRFNIVDKPNSRSSHNTIIVRGGGIIFLLGYWIGSLLFNIHYPWFLIGLTLVCIVSFIDDLHSLPDSVRLVTQFAGMFLMLIDLGIVTTDYWWLIIITMIVGVGIINAYNFMDGINGITGGYSLAILIPLIVINSTLHFIEQSYLIIATISCFVFCFFNFRPKGKAKCFAGDVGSIGIAFILLFPIGKLMLNTHNLTYILLLAVYGVDSILTICHRIMLHENLGQAHRKHAYQLMANELKIPHEVVSLCYTALQLAISFGLIYMIKYDWIFSVCIILVLCGAYIWFMKRYYPLHEEYLKSIKN